MVFNKTNRKLNGVWVALFLGQAFSVVVVSLTFPKDAMEGVKTLFGFRDDIFVSSIVLCGLFCCLAYYSMARWLPNVAYFIPWSLPLFMGIVSLPFQQGHNILHAISPHLKAAAMSYLVMMSVLFRGRPQLSDGLHLAKDASTVVSVNPTLAQQLLLSTTLFNLWMISWASVVFSVFTWRDMQRLLVGCDTETAVCVGGRGVQQGLYLLLTISLIWTYRTFDAWVQTTSATAVLNWWNDLNKDSTVAHQTFWMDSILMSWRFVPHQDDQTQPPLMNASRPSESEDHCPSGSDMEVLASETQTQFKHVKPACELAKIVDYYCGDVNKHQDSPLSETDLTSLQQSMESFFWLLRIAIALTSGNLVWMSDTNQSFGTFQLGFAFGWVASTSFVAIIRAASRALVVGLSGYQPDGNLLKTSIFFGLKRVIQSSNKTSSAETTQTT